MCSFRPYLACIPIYLVLLPHSPFSPPPFPLRPHIMMQTRSKLYLALDYVPGGDFFSMLVRDGPVSESRAVLYAAEIVLALVR